MTILDKFMNFMNNKCVKTQYLIVRPYIEYPSSGMTIMFDNEKYLVVGTYDDMQDLQDSIARNGLDTRCIILKIEGLSKVDVNINITFSDNNK